MTDYNEKLRAVLLAAIMVFSVFAGTVALSGSAAAGGSSTVTVTQLDPSGNVQNVTITHDVDFNVTDIQNNTGPGTQLENFTVEFDSASSNEPEVTNVDLTVTNSSGVDVTDSDGVTSSGDDAEVLFEAAGASGEEINVAGTVTVDYSPIIADSTSVDLTGVVVDDAGTNTDSIGTITVRTSAGRTRAGVGGSGAFDTANGAGTIFDGATVFQGETDIELAGSISGGLVKTAGNDEGVTLQTPDVPQDQSTGRYTTNGNAGSNGVIVDTPRVTTLDIENNNGEDIAGGTIREGDDSSGAGRLTVVGAFTYDAAEDLELTVEDESGLDVTDDVLEAGSSTKQTADKGGPVPGTRPGTSLSSNEVGYPIDLSDIGTGTYTVILEGTDDLDFGDASSSTTIEVTGDNDVSIELGETDVTRGQDVRFDITSSDAGDRHVVIIEEDDFRDGITISNQQDIFRNVGDTDDTGVVSGGGTTVGPGGSPGDTDYAYAVVEFDDDGVGQGSIESQYLDDTDVDVIVYEESFTSTDSTTGNLLSAFDQTTSTAEDNEADDETLTIEEGEIEINSPGETYVVGSEVDVNGTADEGIDDVAFFVRRQNDYRILQIDGQLSLNVDADDTFEEEGAEISQGNGGGNDLLSQPGTYRLGAVDTEGLTGSLTVSSTLETAEFNTNTSTQQAIRVVDTELSANVNTIGGQVAIEDSEINLSGDAFGAQSVTVVFVGERGNTFINTISVDDDNTYNEGDFTIGGDLAEGEVSVHLLIEGRDGEFGDDSFSDVAGITPSDFQDFVERLDNDGSFAGPGSGLTGDQVRSRIVDETIEETASDDRMETQTFRYADAQTTVDTVFPEGMEAAGVNPVGVDDTMVVEGSTNLIPDDNSITVELLTQDGDSVALTTTEEWTQDGSYTVSLELSDVQTGSYVIESDDSFNTDVADVEIVQEVQTATPEPTDTPTPTEGDGPGFGAIVAVIALLAAALLATRRND